MRKIKDYIAVCSLSLCGLFCSMHIFSQDLNGIIRENIALEGEIGNLYNDSILNTSRITDLYGIITTDSLEIDSLGIRLLDLEKMNSKETAEMLLSEVDSLNAVIVAMKAKQEEKLDAIAQLQHLINESKQSVQQNEIYYTAIKEKRYKEHKEFLYSKFNSMSEGRLDSIASTVIEFQNMQDYSEYQDRVHCVVRYKKLYDSANQAIQSSYDESAIESIRAELIPILEIKQDNKKRGIFKLTNEQFEEMDSLDIKLSRYRGGILALRKVIERINNDSKIILLRKEAIDSIACINAIKKYIRPEIGSEGDKVVQRYFTKIPYLMKLLNDYWSEIKANPFEYPTRVEKEIFAIKVEF